jgi:hypothetical protein
MVMFNSYVKLPEGKYGIWAPTIEFDGHIMEILSNKTLDLINGMHIPFPQAY